jgi:hypothetical protein
MSFYTEGVTEGDVSDNATLEESPRAHALGAVNDLVRDNLRVMASSCTTVVL